MFDPRGQLCGLKFALQEFRIVHGKGREWRIEAAEELLGIQESLEDFSRRGGMMLFTFFEESL